MRRVRLISVLAAMTMAAPAWALDVPKAEKRPHAIAAPAGTRNDEYYWLRDDTRKDPQMLGYLAAENAYADTVMAPTKALQQRLYGEFTGRVKQDDVSVPTRDRGYWYYTRFDMGQDYPVHARRKGTIDGPDEVLLDEAAAAAGKNFYAAHGLTVSQDNRLLAWAEDTIGRRQYVLRVKDIATGKILEDRVPNIEDDLVWADDNRTILYIDKDPVTLLSKRVKAHVLGTPASADRLVYEEPDNSYYVSLKRTKSDRFLCIYLSSTVATEQRCAPAGAPADFQPLTPRLKDHRYDADHVDGRWVIRTNWDAPNYRLMTLADGQARGDRVRWKPFVPVQKAVFIEAFEAFDGFTAIEERADGVKRLRLIGPDGKATFVKADEPAYSMTLGDAPEANTTRFRYIYTSLTTPPVLYEADVATGQKGVLKEQPVPGYDKTKYVTERVWAPARDGTRIPVSLVYRKGFRRDGTAALYQYGYGSYGASMDPNFSLPAISLLDRGMVYAIAHVRGGQEMGRAWYDQGHLMTKENTFTDFIDVTRHLVKSGYAAKDRVAAEGRSAGGLLMGAIANMAPQDYRAIVAGVPFVDVVTTMLDETIPLTTNEFDEWGNPKDAKAYKYMLAYSPYDNVGRHGYPALFVATSLWDSQVQYFEPAKWVARLRDRKTDANPLVFRVNMEAGHGGKTGRFQKYLETAESYAFVLRELGVESVSAAPDVRSAGATAEHAKAQR